MLGCRKGRLDAYASCYTSCVSIVKYKIMIDDVNNPAGGEQQAPAGNPTEEQSAGDSSSA